METLRKDLFTPLDLDFPIWEHIFMVAPLVIIGTKEEKGYDLAPKHMATPLGFGNYFGFVCTPRHGTYGNIKENGEFTVSFPKPDQITTTSLSASPRKDNISKSQGVVEALSIVKANGMDAPLIKDAYLYLECELYLIIDGFDHNSIITGIIKAAYVDKDYLRVSDRDEQEQLYKNPLLVYIAPGRFAEVSDTFNFPFPKGFQK